MKNNERENNYHNQDFYKGVFIGGIVVFLLIFAFVFGLKLGRQDFNPRRLPPMIHPFFNDKRNDYFVPKKIRGHGLFGQVDSVAKESFVVKDRWGELITVLVDKNTQYRVDGKTANFSNIKKGKNVLVVGEPDNQELAIRAIIIRIF